MALSTSVPAGGGSQSGFVLSLTGIMEGGYRYTEYLLALESQQADGLPQLSLPHTHTPVVVTSLLPALRLHPDQRFVEYIWNGLLAGFRIGFSRRCPLQSPVGEPAPRGGVGAHQV